MKLNWKMNAAFKLNRWCELTFCPCLPPCLCCAFLSHPLAFHFFSMLITNLLQSETTATRYPDISKAAMTPHQKRELRQPKEWSAQKTEVWLIKADTSPHPVSNFLSRACFCLAQKCAATTPYEPTRLKVLALGYSHLSDCHLQPTLGLKYRLCWQMAVTTASHFVRI